MIKSWILSLMVWGNTQILLSWRHQMLLFFFSGSLFFLSLPSLPLSLQFHSEQLFFFFLSLEKEVVGVGSE